MWWIYQRCNNTIMHIMILMKQYMKTTFKWFYIVTEHILMKLWLFQSTLYLQLNSRLRISFCLDNKNLSLVVVFGLFKLGFKACFGKLGSTQIGELRQQQANHVVWQHTTPYLCSWVHLSCTGNLLFIIAPMSKFTSVLKKKM